MLLDTEHNSKTVVMSNIYEMFMETGMKFHCYLKSLTIARQPTLRILCSKFRSLDHREQMKVEDLSEWLIFSHRNCARCYLLGPDLAEEQDQEGIISEFSM
jgi:hypothetical protein